MSETKFLTSVDEDFIKIQKEISNDFKLLFSEYEASNQKLANVSKLLEASKLEYRKLDEENKKNINYIHEYNNYVGRLKQQIEELKDLNFQLEEEIEYNQHELRRKVPKMYDENELDDLASLSPPTVETDSLQPQVEIKTKKQKKQRVGISKAL